MDFTSRTGGSVGSREMLEQPQRDSDSKLVTSRVRGACMGFSCLARRDAAAQFTWGTNQCRVRFTKATSEIATATASSKKFEVPIRQAGAAMLWGSLSQRAPT